MKYVRYSEINLPGASTKFIIMELNAPHWRAWRAGTDRQLLQANLGSWRHGCPVQQSILYLVVRYE